MAADRDADAALKDAGVDFKEVEQAYAGYVFGDSTCGQRAVYEVGLTGIPVFNVNNNCSTGSSALMLARQAVIGGIAECVLAVGFEKMEQRRARLQVGRPHATRSISTFEVMNDLQGFVSAPPTAQLFGGAAREYRWRTAPSERPSARSAAKPASTPRRTHTRSSINRSPLEEVMASRRGLRSADPLPVLPPDLRRRSRDRLHRRVRQEEGHRDADQDRRPIDEDRLRLELRARSR